MQLPDRLDSILDSLPPAWAEARLVLTVADASQADQAALVLGPLGPGRSGTSFFLTISSSGAGGPTVDRVRRTLARLEEEGIDARLALPGSAAVRTAPAEHEDGAGGLAGRLDELLAGMPPDWSDLYLEVELSSSDDLDRAALLLGPVNPFLYEGQRPRLRFRAARSFGYGAAPEMARRVLARLDEAGIRGRLRLLRQHADVRPAHSQGLVWREGGRAI